VQELFSLLNFLEPDRFHSSELFLTEFGDLRTEAQVERLKAVSNLCFQLPSFSVFILTDF